MSALTLSEVGEFGFLNKILPSLPTSLAVTIGPGDDCAVAKFQGQVAVSTDVLVEGVHFRRDWSSARDIGRKSVAVNVADLEAMGVEPITIVIGLSAPGSVEVDWLTELMAGVVEESQRAHITLVGGDVTRSRDVTLCATVMGQTNEVAPVTRSGARVGDIVALCGRVGYAAAGLAVLQRGFRSPREVVEAQRVPTPPYGQGRVAALSGATSMIDISDGLIGDARHVCDMSQVGINLFSDHMPLSDLLRDVGTALGLDPLGFVLAGGEDHALLATFPPDVVLPPRWQPIGEVISGHDVLVDGAAWNGAGGWDHYQY